MELQQETLSDDELATITGYKLPSRQIQQLKLMRWEFTLTGANRPVVGRIYARLKLAGVKPSVANAVSEPWSLDLSRVG